MEGTKPSKEDLIIRMKSTLTTMMETKKPSREDQNKKWNKVRNICFSKIFENSNERVLNAQEQAVKNNYGPFIKYINNAFDAAKYKETIKVSYQTIDRKTEYHLSKYVIIDIKNKIMNGKILPYDADFYARMEASKFKLETIHPHSISVDGKEVPFFTINDKYIVKSDENTKILIDNDDEITITRERYYPRSIIYKGKSFENRQSRVNIDIFDDDDTLCYDADYPEIIFELKYNKDINARYEHSLELQDTDVGNSVIDEFFSDTARQIYFNDDRNHKATIKNKQREIGRLDIQFEDTSIIPPKTGIIHLVTDTNQLKRQKAAITVLKSRPSVYQKPLLDLAFDYNKVPRLEIFLTSLNHLNYVVLTDIKRKGVDEQREFVRKAMDTPDFIILQGPPGSGKTTAILELIYQLNKRGKKVLLCASTHVAIDNVIEKILKSDIKDKLLEEINLVRIGDENNVYSEDVKQYTYSNLHKEIPDDYSLIADQSFNLVCGTIIGVLNFPLINRLLDQNRQNCIEPIFDYLIIDEASKTTFSEFLVPAILSKRWIIVGDVKQLAPYIDQEDLVPNVLMCPALEAEDKREALTILETLNNKKHVDKLKNRAYILKAGSIEYIANHLPANIKDINTNNFVAVSNKESANIFNVTKSDIMSHNWKTVALYAPDCTFLIEDNLADEVAPLLYKKVEIFDKRRNLHQLNEKTYLPLFFKNAAASGMEPWKYDEKYQMYSRKIENEIVWRLIRLYELGPEQKCSAGYNEFIDRVKSIFNDSERTDFENTINILKNVAIPSIITMLQEGVDKGNKHQTRLTCGLTPDEKETRFVKLSYQHRMHQDISKFSRINVYKSTALKDAPQWKSQLNYLDRQHHLEIRDVNYKDNIIKNVNPEEVNAIMEELDRFMEFAETHPKTDGSDIQIAILSFYNGQVMELRKKLRSKFHAPKNLYNFRQGNIRVSLNTVDKFQGQEADVVYLSTVQNKKTGFLDSVSRLNVAVTRAKEHVIVFGNKEYFSKLPEGVADVLKSLFSQEGGYYL